AGAEPAGAATKEEIEEELGFEKFEVTMSDTQAGGHPDFFIDAKFATGGVFSGKPLPAVRRIGVDSPTGFIRNPHVTPKCTLAEFSSAACPIDSQVGTVGVPSLGIFGIFFPLYNIETRPDQAGLLGFIVPLLGATVYLELSARTDSDYGLRTISTA